MVLSALPKTMTRRPSSCAVVTEKTELLCLVRVRMVPPVVGSPDPDSAVLAVRDDDGSVVELCGGHGLDEIGVAGKGELVSCGGRHILS